jgi:hypothetical protein
MDAVSVFRLADGQPSAPAAARQSPARPALSEPEDMGGRFVAQQSSRKVPVKLPASLDDEWAEF